MERLECFIFLPSKRVRPEFTGACLRDMSGTSVTNTIVSMAHSGDRLELERAFSGATVHDMLLDLVEVVTPGISLRFDLHLRLAAFCVELPLNDFSA